MPAALRAIDRLRKAANLEPTKKTVKLSDGSDFDMWVTPLTMAERERAQKQAKSDDANAFALQLLLNKACDDTGARMFSAAEIDVLKNEVKDKDLQSLMLAIIMDDADAEAMDPKP
jgi:cell division inhibitor SulA